MVAYQILMTTIFAAHCVWAAILSYQFHYKKLTYHYDNQRDYVMIGLIFSGLIFIWYLFPIAILLILVLYFDKHTKYHYTVIIWMVCMMFYINQ